MCSHDLVMDRGLRIVQAELSFIIFSRCKCVWPQIALPMLCHLKKNAQLSTPSTPELQSSTRLRESSISLFGNAQKQVFSTAICRKQHTPETQRSSSLSIALASVHSSARALSRTNGLEFASGIRDFSSSTERRDSFHRINIKQQTL